ncbi:MAG TPA: hypothetical protein VJN96_07475 [Vicinamibacterales bacterium]|nr:hypothetical protein [Vicinamibacterales bacterium]
MTTFYLTVRFLHVLAGAIWVGFAIFSAFFLMPAMKDAGPDGAKVMAALERRGFIAFIPIVVSVAIFSGLWLYWRYTGGFSPEISRSHAGMAFGTGGALAIVAAIIGIVVVSRSLAKASALTKQAMAMPESARGPLMATIGPLRLRAMMGARIVAVLVTITIGLMSIGLLL